jgi:hypothetical protein
VRGIPTETRFSSSAVALSIAEGRGTRPPAADSPRRDSGSPVRRAQGWAAAAPGPAACLAGSCPLTVALPSMSGNAVAVLNGAALSFVVLCPATPHS